MGRSAQVATLLLAACGRVGYSGAGTPADGGGLRDRMADSAPADAHDGPDALDDSRDGGVVDAQLDADGPSSDAALDGEDPTDTGLADSDGCAPATELCNGLDDDCDGVVDETFDLLRDPDHCGACSSPCDPGDVCEGGACWPPDALAELRAGFQHTCARYRGGEVYCWGDNSTGQLGVGAVGDLSARGAAVHVVAASGAEEITCGWMHNCMRNASGEVRCWGWNQDGALGNGTRTSSVAPVSVLGVDNAAGVAAGGGFSCAVLGSGEVWCWGRDVNGQLGNGEPTTGGLSTTAVQVTGLDDASAVAAGYEHACALRADGSVVCWGRNARGQLGDGTNSDRDAPVAVADLADVREIALGASHSCARLGSGEVRCWGAGLGLGAGTAGDQASPVAALGIDDAVAISSSGSHSCAIRSTGAIACWGANAAGQLGDGYTDDRYVALDIDGVAEVRLVAAGGDHTCYRALGGTVQCVGGNRSGQLGSGEPAVHPWPLDVPGMTDAVEVGVGTTFACARRTTGVVECWGAGRLGDGIVSTASGPVAVSGIADATDLLVGESGACAQRAGSAFECWGTLPGGHSSLVPLPLTVFPFPLSSLGLGPGYHMCAVDASGGAHCVGYNYEGQLGDGTTTDRPTPVGVTGLASGVAAIAPGIGHTCALLESGGLRCWGWGAPGGLGDGSGTQRLTPVAVAEGDVWASVTSGQHHTCGRRLDATVACWGWNHEGQVGDGSFVNQLLPRTIASFSGGLPSAGRELTCAPRLDGRVYCAGIGGVLGDESLVHKSAPVPVVGLTTASTVAAGTAAACAVYGGGRVACWGTGTNGLLGTPGLERRLAPAPVDGLP